MLDSSVKLTTIVIIVRIKYSSMHAWPVHTVRIAMGEASIE